MKNTVDTLSAFVQVETIHQGEVSWWWRNEWLHDNDYQLKVDESVNVKVKEIILKYDVQDDCEYRTQWEGRLFFGTDLKNVTNAANELAQYIVRFKGVVSLQEFAGS